MSENPEKGRRLGRDSETPPGGPTCESRGESSRGSASVQGTSGRVESRPSFPFYARDFLSSPRVRRMSLEERGAYITLLCDAWVDVGLEPDAESIADRLGIDLEAAERLMAGQLGRCFVLVDGRLVSPRMERERQRLDERSRMLSEAGARGGRARPSQAQARLSQAKARPGQAEASPSQAEARLSTRAELSRAEHSPPSQTTSQVLREGATAPVVEPVEPGMPEKAPDFAPVASGGVGVAVGTSEPQRVRRAKRAACTLDEQLAEFEFCGLQADVIRAAKAWSEYRRTRRRRLSPWGPAQWRPHLRRALAQPAAFVEAVRVAVENGWQGLFPRGGSSGQSIEDLAAVAARLDARLAAEGLL